MAAWVPKFLEVDRVSITLINDEGKLDMLAVQGLKISPVGTTFPLDGTLVGQAFTTQEIVEVSDISNDTIDGRTLTKVGMRSCMSAPLISVGRSYGTFNVAHANPGHFTPQDQRIVGALSSLLASFVRVHFEMEEQQRRARIDSLTGALNRSGFMAELESRFEAKSGLQCLLFLDLDGFKAINDAYGHAAGDKMLIDMAERFRRALRPEDLLGRIGGDEFVVICDPGDGQEVGMGVAERLLFEGQQLLAVGPTMLSPRLSIGLAVADTRVDTAERTLAEADLAMYEAKKSKSFIVSVDENLRTRSELVAVVDRDLDRAMATNEMSFFLQPIWELETGRLSGAEALVRWNHPIFGEISPPFLIDRVEATGRVERFTEWSLNLVARHIVDIRRRIPTGETIRVSLNLTPRQLSWTHYVDVHLETLERHDLDAADLAIEVIESGVVDVGTSAEDTLRALADESVSIALDNFGTGSNALGYFIRFHTDAIKIDRTLIGAMATSDPTRTIVQGLVSMSRQLGIQVSAEGIELQSEADLCRELGVQFGQGYHLGRPMPVDDFVAVVLSMTQTSSGYKPGSV